MRKTCTTVESGLFKTLALQSEVKGPGQLSESVSFSGTQSHALLQSAQWDLDLTSISGDQGTEELGDSRDEVEGEALEKTRSPGPS